MQIELNRVKGNGIRWAIGTEHGPRGSMWRLWGNKKGDFYLAARVMGGILKTSFHKDGNCHSGLTAPYAEKHGVTSRHMDQWRLASEMPARALQVLMPASDLRVFPLSKPAKDVAWLTPPASDALAVVTLFISGEPPGDLAVLAPPPSTPIGILGTAKRFCWAVYATNPVNDDIDRHVAAARGAILAVPESEKAPKKPGIRGIVMAGNGPGRTIWELAWDHPPEE